MNLNRSAEAVADLLGIGFGPSNVAVAIAVTEHNETHATAPVVASFLEQKPAFAWHRGMLLDGATMQVAFLKDLVTLRNPASRFGFVAYLHAKDRLIDFINHRVLYPSRVEFHDYLNWCAEQLDPLVRYGRRVVSARPVRIDGMVTHYEVSTDDVSTGERSVRRTRNIVVAPGLEPLLPDGVTPSHRIWHSHFLLERIGGLGVAHPRRFLVVGAGQSAAEVADYLHRTYPAAEIYALFSRFGYSQSDDSPFANRIFDPRTVDVFHGAPAEVKAMLMRYHGNTNYSVVDADLIEELYRRTYQERVRGIDRLHLLNVSELAGVREVAGGVEVAVRRMHTGELVTVTADAVVCATGYRPTDPRSVLGEVAPLLWTDDNDQLLVERDYRVATGPEVLGGVYLCGGTEHSHGITSSLLSMAALRAGEILRSVLERAGTSTGPPSYVASGDHV